MFGGGSTNPYDEVVTKTTDENLTSENWELIMNLCDKVQDEGQDGAHSVIAAVLKRLAHRNPNVQLYALSLSESLSKNCDIQLHREIASRAFTQGLEKLITDRTTHEKVRQRALGLIAMWTAEFEHDSTLGLMEDCFKGLQAKNYRFETPQETPPPTVDDEIRRKEEEDLQRVLALSIQDKGGRGQWDSSFSAGGSSSAAAASGSHAVTPSSYAPTYAGGYAPARTPSPKYTQPAVPMPIESTTPAHTAATSTGVVTRVRALHTFEPTESGELGFEKGDIIKVVDRGYKDWWRGQIKGRTGIFPVNYVEAMPEPTAAELGREAEQEAAVFAQAINVEKLLTMLRQLDPSKDNLADNEEIQELYRSSMALRPKIVKLIDKYSQKRADLVSMNETFVRARTIFDRMMEESLARHSGVYDQGGPYRPPAQGFPRPESAYGYGAPPSGYPTPAPAGAYPNGQQPYAYGPGGPAPYGQPQPIYGNYAPQPYPGQAPGQGPPPSHQQGPTTGHQGPIPGQQGPAHGPIPGQSVGQQGPALGQHGAAAQQGPSPSQQEPLQQQQMAQQNAGSQQPTERQVISPYVYDPNTTYADPNVQAWAQYYAKGGKDLAGAVYFISVPGVTDEIPHPQQSQPVQQQQPISQQQQPISQQQQPISQQQQPISQQQQPIIQQQQQQQSIQQSIYQQSIHQPVRQQSLPQQQPLPAIHHEQQATISSIGRTSMDALPSPYPDDAEPKPSMTQGLPQPYTSSPTQQYTSGPASQQLSYGSTQASPPHQQYSSPPPQQQPSYSPPPQQLQPQTFSSPPQPQQSPSLSAATPSWVLPKTPQIPAARFGGGAQGSYQGVGTTA